VNDTLFWYTARGAGVVSLLLLTGSVGLGVASTWRQTPGGWPRFLIGGLHRNVALLTLLFLGLHILTAVVDPFTHLGWTAALVPFASWYRPFWLGLGTVAAELLLAIVATSLLRRFLGYGAWRAVHWLTYASWPVALVHGLGTGSDSGSLWLRALYGVCLTAVLVLIGARLWLGPSDPLVGARLRFREAVQRPLEQ
jgi:methionine sulfoxide reductase heme-binding subunit